MTDDPRDLVRAALEGLPDDPTQADADDLLVLAAVEEGLTRMTLAAHGRMTELFEATTADSISFDDAMREQAELSILTAQLSLADAVLTRYVRDAVEARGVDLDGLLKTAESLSQALANDRKA